MDANLTQAVVDVLRASLSPDPATRQNAEVQLEHFFEQGESGAVLATLLVSPNYDLDLRQMSRGAYFTMIADPYHQLVFLALLRNHSSEEVRPGALGSPPSTEIKDHIRDTLIHGLSDPTRKIRASAGYALSTIAQSDWPDECPDLLTKLLNLLSTGTPDTVDGAMRVFAEFTKSELSEEQLLPILRELLPVLMNILGAPDKHAPLTRSRVLSVFNQCIEVLYMVKDQHTQAVKEATEVILPLWLNAFQVLLQLDPRQDTAPSDNWDNLSVRLQVFKVLERVTYYFPRAISPTISIFLASALNHLDSMLLVYRAHFAVPDAASPPGTSEDPGETNLLPKLGSAVMEFTVSASRTKAAKAWFAGEGTAILASLLTCTVAWAQMTLDDETEWAADANAFVADENEEDTWTLRGTGFDLVSSVLDACPVPTTTALQNVMQKTIQDSSAARTAGQTDWWKPLEAMLAAVGSIAEDLIECNEDETDSGRPAPFSVEPLLVDLIPPLLSLGDFPFLQGRGFVFASQFSGLLPASLFSQYLSAAIEALESPNVSMPVKVSAVKAIQNFSSQSGAKGVIVPLAPRIARDLTPFLPEATEESLTLIVEALLSVIDMDESAWLTPELTAPLVLAMMDVWVKNVKDPILLSVLTDVFVAIAKSPAPGVYHTIVTNTLPALSAAIAQASAEEGWIVSSAIDLTTSLIRGAPKGGLGDGFFNMLGPALFGCILNTEDREIIQNGIECLTLVIRKGCDQLLAFVSSTGETGLSLLLKLTGSLLTPTTSESEAGGLFIGDMLVHLLKNAGTSQELRAVLPELITALVKRMETAQTATFMQSLIVPLAYLLHTQREDVITLLESTPVGTTTGLDVLLKAWCDNTETFQGSWATKISTVAMCDTFVSQRPSLQSIQVKGDLIIRPETSNVIMTRSRTKKIPTEYTSIPFHVRALKILIRELQQSGNEAVAAAQGAQGKDTAADVDLDGDDEGDEWAEEEDLFQGLKNEELGFLSQYIDNAATDDFDGPDQADDEDLKDDPISQVDIRMHLLGFFKQCAQADPDGFSRLVDELNADEILVIKRAINA